MKDEGFCTAADNSSCLQEKVEHDHAVEMSAVEEAEKEEQHYGKIFIS